MSRTRALWPSLAMLLASTLAAASPADAERELLAADAARTAAMVAVDTAVLERALGDDLSYGHSTGQVQGKRELIDELRSGVRRYRAITGEETSVRLYGCAGVVSGKALAEVEYRDRPLALNLRYTATYARQHDRWVLVAYQSVRLPDPAPATPR